MGVVPRCNYHVMLAESRDQSGDVSEKKMRIIISRQTINKRHLDFVARKRTLELSFSLEMISCFRLLNAR